MGVVELNLVLLGELGPVAAVRLFVSADDVLDGSRAEEVLLLQPELLA